MYLENIHMTGTAADLPGHGRPTGVTEGVRGVAHHCQGEIHALREGVRHGDISQGAFTACFPPPKVHNGGEIKSTFHIGLTYTQNNTARSCTYMGP